MRDVAERRQLLEAEHKEALLVLQEKQEEVRRLQQVCSMGEKVLVLSGSLERGGTAALYLLGEVVYRGNICESTK